MKEIYEKQNSLQTWSETDSFTVERYIQFSKFMDDDVAKILDIGCNTGRGAIKLKEINPKYLITGIDVVESRLSEKNVFEELIYGSFTELDKKYNGVFNYVVSGEVIEHILPNEVDIFLSKIYDVLQNGGHMLLTTPNPNSLLVKLGNKAVFNDPSHFSIMSASTLKRKVSKAGFKNIKIYGSGKATRYLSYKFPLLFPFGSYLIIGEK